mmetsp:Transcript_5130/g.14644  ORF Transcript_5130/g.14644 Transcript_5130/m.14644 type:complete len:380 (-) Transcript_5130:442-1581(-)
MTANAVAGAAFASAMRGEGPTSPTSLLSREDVASIQIQSAWRCARAVRVLTAKRFVVRLMTITSKVEDRKARTIQAAYRAHHAELKRLAIYSKSRELDALVKGQAARQMRGALDKIHLATELKGELRILMEKGRVYPLTNGGELISWGVRYAYVGESEGRQGLCYQHVNTRTLIPFGKVKGIPWDSIRKVEVLLDNTVCIETVAKVKYNFRPVKCSDPASVSWFWALRLCQLGDLLGFRYEGFVADAARDENEKLAQPEPWVAALQDTKLEPELNEEYSDEIVEAERRRQWVRYFVKNGYYQRARELGWDGRIPPDPRGASRSNGDRTKKRGSKFGRAPLKPGARGNTGQSTLDQFNTPKSRGSENVEPPKQPSHVTRI